MIPSDVLLAAGLLVALAAALWVQGLAVEKEWLRPGGSRKLGHVGLGVAFLGSMLLYADPDTARWIASGVAAVLFVFFLGLAWSWWGSDVVVGAVSRSAERRECRTGPAYFALAFAVLFAVFGREAPTGLAALGVLVFGDAAGEIVGRSVRSPALPWNRDKSLAGSLGVVLAGWAGAFLVLWAYARAGWLVSVPEPWRIGAVALAGGVVESLPVREVDNLTIPAACAVTGVLLLA